MLSWPNRRFSAFVALLAIASLGFVAAPHEASGQDAVTISGHVSGGGVPLQGATVRISQLDLGATTDADGAYSFIVPSSRVRGQAVSLVARHVRFAPTSVTITLVGGSLVQDFDLSPTGAGAARRPNQPSGPSAPSTQRHFIPSPVAAGPLLDSTAFADVAGPLDLPRALAGRLAGVSVSSSAALGGSSSVLIRGARSIASPSQPLYVVDGMPIDNSTVTTDAQRFGFGGFDYGSAVQDLNLDDIKSVELLDGPVAAARYGARAANGVILVSTKDGRGLNGFEVSASQQVSFETPLRLPSYQNSYGQGLNGKFSFFNGKGDGINDAVAESWGPALQGQPIPQASLTQPEEADVRAWLARPNNVNDYFDRGHVFTTNGAAQGSNDKSNFRFALGNRSFTGLSPSSSVARRSAGLTVGTQPSTALIANAHLEYFNDQAGNLPGSGVDEINPIAEFARIGRQLDIAALRTHLVDSRGRQISWNYAGRNNPFFQPLENSNGQHRSRFLASLGATYSLAPWLTAEGRAGSDSYNESRAFSVAPGWMGGYPFYFGRAAITGPASQDQKLDVAERTAEVVLRAAPASAPWIIASAGANLRRASLDLANTAKDTTTADSLVRQAMVSSRPSFATNTHAVFVGADLFPHDAASVALTGREEASSIFAAGSQSHFYPAVIGSLDLKRTVDAVRASRAISSATVHAGWSQSSGDLSQYQLLSLYTGNQPVDSVSLAAASPVRLSPALSPEITSAFEIGGDLAGYGSRLQLGLSLYSETTNDVILALPAGTAVTATNAASISNKGIEATLGAVPLQSARGLEWAISANVAKNKNTVESLAGGAKSLALAPTRWGTTLEAIRGQPLGAIVGAGFLRDDKGALVLRNGAPLPDTAGGPRVLGVGAPSWTGGVTNTLDYRSLELSVLVDARFGGSVFSASNMLGATSGVLEETAFRPDSGLLIAGVDGATGKANTTHISTQDYFHALGSIPARWVYDASFAKLREARLSVTFPLRWAAALQAQGIRASIIGRNLAMWTKAPNIDPESLLSLASAQGLELGQLPTVRSVGIQISLTP